MLDVKVLLTKILALLSAQFTTETYNCNAGTLSAGTIGAYATLQSFSITKTNYTPIGIFISKFGHPGAYNVSVSMSDDRATGYMIFFRGLSSAYSLPANDVQVTVLYQKN